ncbi:MAG: K+-transporting ATPase A subunit [Crocinitomicaceae bacterium]|jgi:K+-transporting ATPase A subunit
MKKFIKNFSLLSLFVLPQITFAQTFKDFVKEVVDLSQVIMPLLFSGALALFIWGVAQFILNANNPEKRQEGKKRIAWGIFALFVLIGYLGLTAVLTGTFFGKSPFLPQLFTQ